MHTGSELQNQVKLLSDVLQNHKGLHSDGNNVFQVRKFTA